MRIEDFAVHRVVVDDKTEWVFLELVADDGTRGAGEALLGGDEALVADALTHAARALVGEDALTATAPADRLARERATGLLDATVRSAIDQCLWDLRARAAGQPLHRMLGALRREAVTLYANINRGTRVRSPRAFAARAAEARENGYQAVKIAPFDGLSRANAHAREGRSAYAAALERVRAVRDALGYEPMLMVDCHWRLDVATALRFLDDTAELRLDWLEDPLPYHDLDGWERLKGSARVQLAGGETARGMRDLLGFLRRGILDVVMPDIRFFGGVSGLAALSQLALEHHVSVAPHNPRGPVATLASAHVMATCPAFSMLEYQYGECAWRGDLVGGAEAIGDGALALPAAPGIGAALDPAVLAEHARR